MPIGTCDPATRGDAFNAFDLEQHLGDGVVRIWGEYGWDGVSTRETGCNGPLNALSVSNTGTAPAYVRLPNKKKGSPFVEIPPGSSTSLSAGQRNQLGLENISDVMDALPSLTSSG